MVDWRLELDRVGFILQGTVGPRALDDQVLLARHAVLLRFVVKSEVVLLAIFWLLGLHILFGDAFPVTEAAL